MKCKVDKQRIVVTEQELLVSSSEGLYYVNFEFSDDWLGFSRTVIFKRRFTDLTTTILLTTNICEVPPEMLTEPAAFVIGVYGDNGELHMPTVWSNIIDVAEGCMTGVQIADPTPSIYQQIISDFSAIRNMTASGTVSSTTGVPSVDVTKSTVDGHDHYTFDFKNIKGDPGINTWGSITGTLSDQADLQSALNAKQDTLVSGVNIKTINNSSVLGSGNLSITESLVIHFTYNGSRHMYFCDTDFSVVKAAIQSDKFVIGYYHKDISVSQSEDIVLLANGVEEGVLLNAQHNIYADVIKFTTSVSRDEELNIPQDDLIAVDIRLKQLRWMQWTDRYGEVNEDIEFAEGKTALHGKDDYDIPKSSEWETFYRGPFTGFTLGRGERLTPQQSIDLWESRRMPLNFYGEGETIPYIDLVQNIYCQGYYLHTIDSTSRIYSYYGIAVVDHVVREVISEEPYYRFNNIPCAVAVVIDEKIVSGQATTYQIQLSGRQLTQPYRAGDNITITNHEISADVKWGSITGNLLDQEDLVETTLFFLDMKVDKSQGEDKAGQFLVVGSDGEVTTESKSIPTKTSDLINDSEYVKVVRNASGSLVFITG